MTPQFITPCYVRVEDADKRKEICEQLQEMGYNLLGMLHVWPVLYVDDGELVGREDEFMLDCTMPPATDCGTNTELFLALASMRSDTDEGQWFTRNGRGFRRCNYANLLDDKTFSALWRKATPAEIIEHFKLRGNGSEVPAAAANYDRKTTLQDVDYE